MDRRDFLQRASAAGAATLVVPTLNATPIDKQAPSIMRGRDDRTVRLGFIGVGLRGRNHLNLALRRDDVTVAAICDIDPAAIALAQDMAQSFGADPIPAYTDGEEDYLNLLQREDIDGVIISTPWLWHTRMAVDTMKHGKYAGVEVSAANTLEECWDLVNTYEATGNPCMILENVCYRRDVMAVLNMVRDNVFGEMVHMECGYQHDLRHVKFNDGEQAYGGGVEFGEKGFSEARWRTWHSVYRNGDLYPTHGIGPVGVMLDINRGNRFTHLVSMSSKARGLHNYIVDQAGRDHPNAKVRFKLGDLVTTQIRTANDETIIVTHDTNLPRPYSLGFRVQGTEGIWMDLNRSLYVQGQSPNHRWEDAAPWLERYDHPLWQKYADAATGAGHGGMDYFVVHAFVEAIKRNAPVPLDAYDAAAWSAITPLSEMSIAQGSAPMPFPDFTRGQWMKRTQTFALDDSY